MKRLPLNLMLILASLIVGVVLGELSLRLFYPRYQYAAESQFKQDPKRIWAPQANSTLLGRHPDTGTKHLIHYNNFALRQHRDFGEADLKSAITLGFFGDSFTANLRLPSQYSFTEPLDYLLNLGSQRFNTLNFGVDGYGTDQSFLYFQETGLSKYLDYVFYVFHTNDIRNIYENNIFTLNDEGALTVNPIHEAAWWVKVASKLHLTYLILDMKQRWFGPAFEDHEGSIKNYFFQRERQRLEKELKKHFHSPRADAIEQDFETGRNNRDLKRSLTIFLSLLQKWRQSVEEKGGKFFIVLLPTPKQGLISPFIDPDFNVIDFSRVFQELEDNFTYSDYRFKNDGHWNEQANLLAAIALYRFLEQEAHLTRLTDQRIKEELFAYYMACRAEWMPTMWVSKGDHPIEKLILIRKKYAAYELSIMEKNK